MGKHHAKTRHRRHGRNSTQSTQSNGQTQGGSEGELSDSYTADSFGDDMSDEEASAHEAATHGYSDDSSDESDLSADSLESAIRSLESHVDDVNASAEALLDDKAYTNSGIGFRHKEPNESTSYSAETKTSAFTSEDSAADPINSEVSAAAIQDVGVDAASVSESNASESPEHDTADESENSDTDQDVSSTETAADTDDESVAKKSEDDEWGFSSGRKGMARETKIGMALILLLMCAFGFVVYRKVQQQQESLLNINSIVKQEKTGQDDADKPVVPKGAAPTTTSSNLPPAQGEPNSGPTSPIQPVAFDGAGGSGVTTLDNNGFGPSAGTPAGTTPGSNPFLLEQPGTPSTASTGAGNGNITQPDANGGSNAFDPFRTQDTQPAPAGETAQPLTLDGSNPTANHENPFNVASNANSGTEVNSTQPQQLDAFQPPIERTAGKVEQPTNDTGFEVVATGATTAVHGLFDGPGLEAQPATLEFPANNAAGNVNAIPLDANGFEQPQVPFELAQNDPKQLTFDDGSKPNTGETQPANNASSTAELDALLNANRAGETAATTTPPANSGSPFEAVDNVRTTELTGNETPRTATNVPAGNPFPGTGISPVPIPIDPNRSASPPLSGIGTTPRNSATRNDRPRVHTVQPGENYWSISRKFYGTPRFNLALAASNSQRIPDPRKMRPGMKVLIPSIGAMRSTYPKLCPKDLATGEVATSGQKEGFSIDQSGNAWFVVGSDDTLGSIAQKHLGRASRWIQVYQLNRQSVPDPNKLPIGTKLRLPSDASDVRIAQEPRTIR